MPIKLAFTLCLLTVLAFAAQAQLPFNTKEIPSRHQQLVVVTTASWNASAASLQLYQRWGNSWAPVGEQLAVVVGKNGLGWGRGLHAPQLQGPQKVEGDGRAPAGIFELGQAFGYGASPPAGCKLPYRQATSRDYWVDAVASPAYNSWVSIAPEQENNPKKYWSSFERMKRADQLYELGIVVKHNMAPVEAGKGSAIFMHIWRSAGAPTIGCTAMRRQDLASLLAWLDPAKHPLLIQAPEEALEKLMQASF